eukprot:TRINITY_DN104991_c0_g1_i1.p1 TRINITY_DN104991_c0_g1~~TRINITY_DN104991_c0_g1_i1.p1  ORF type:complete len:344 (+),score=36.93 TRINITY_DN104991_c0_g1_i1:185-1216(+)
MQRIVRAPGVVLLCMPPRRQFLTVSPARWDSISSVTEESVDAPWLPPARSQPRASPMLPPTLREQQIGFIGWGAMAQAVSLGILRKGLTETANIAVTDVVPHVLECAAKEGLQRSESNRNLVESSDIVVMAVKPQMVGPVLHEIESCWTKRKILVSICAGVTIATYQDSLGSDAKVVRVMPNTPCLVGEAATAFAGSSSCEEWELDLVHGMFAAVGGATHRVPEYLLNTVTGLSGSGPAYVYMMIQALSDAGVHGGLPRNVSLSLAVQTVIGAAKMVQDSGQHPSVLKEAVTSPAGTTIAGVRMLEKMNFNSAIIEAVEAARARSESLSQKPDFLFEQGRPKR